MSPGTDERGTASQQNSIAGIRILAFTLLLLTAAFALAWSHIKLLSQDEVFVLQTDSVSSVRELITIQRHYPISLDPLLYHLLAHAATKLFGAGAFALRLPSLLGYLLMQVCLYFIVRRIAGDRAGLIALGIPALAATLFYATEARPYGLLLGLYGVVLLCWQSATRLQSKPRRGWLLGLALGLAAALNTHYFAVLLLVPLCGAELYRTLQQRKPDWPVVFAIIAGMAGIVLALPFQKAAGEFRKNYYNEGSVGLHAITQSYRALFVAYTNYSIGVQHVAMALLVVLAIALILAVWRVLRSRTLLLPNAELIFLLILAGLPFLGFLLARFVTHSIEVRYVLGAILGLAAFIAIALTPMLRSRTGYAMLVALLFAGIIAGGAERLREERAKTQTRLAALELSPAIKARLLTNPDSHLWLQDMGMFDENTTAMLDPEVRSHLALVYSQENEIRWDHHDTASLTAMHMQHFTSFTITPWDTLRHTPGEHLMLLYHSGWDWTDQALDATHAQVTPLGHAMGGDVVAVRWSPWSSPR